jgi:hypothetical protein
MQKRKDRAHYRGSDKEADEAMLRIIGNESDSPEIEKSRNYMQEKARTYQANAKRAFESGRAKQALEYAKRAVVFYRSLDNYEQALEVATYAADMAEEYGLKNPFQGQVESIKKRIEALKNQREGKFSGLVKKLEYRLPIAASIIGIISGLIFTFPSITGNVIGEYPEHSLIGALLFYLGLIGLYFSTKKKH